MRGVGLEPSDDELANMITEVDGSGKGAVDFAEFMKMMSKNGTSTAAEIKETFGLFNKSGNGVISAAELKAIMVAMGEKVLFYSSSVAFVTRNSTIPSLDLLLKNSVYHPLIFCNTKHSWLK